MHAAAFTLPNRIIQYANESRLSAHMVSGGIQSSAFIAKPTLAGSYEHRRTDQYIGIYILRGSGVFTDHRGDIHAVQAGEFIQMPPMLPHGVVQNPDGLWIEVWMTLLPDFAHALENIGMIQYEKTVLKPGLQHDLITDFEHMLEEMKRVDAQSGQRATILAQTILMKTYSYDAAATPRDASLDIVDELRQFLSQDLEKRVDLPQLAAQFPLSYERLRKIFKKQTGYSLADFRIRKRIELAQALLEHRQLPVKQVAQMLGYADPFTFSRQFRKFTGRAPSSYLLG